MKPADVWIHLPQFGDGYLATLPYLPVYARCLNAVQAKIRALRLEGVASSHVIVRKVPWAREVTQGAIAPPAIVISPEGPESMSANGGTNLCDDVGYPILITIIAADDEQLAESLRLPLLWREQIGQAFRNQRLAPVREIIACQVEPRDVVGHDAYRKGILQSALLVRCISREPRASAIHNTAANMILSYGNYRHDLSEAGVVIQRETLFAPSGIATAVRERWRIEGVLQAETQPALTAAIAALCAAYAQQGEDVVLYLPDGTTPSAHRITSSTTLGGVRVTRQPSFPDGRGAEYTTYRSYAIELEADIPIEESSTLIVDWDEVLNFSGGGPRWVYLATLSGAPVRQQVQSATPYRVTQSGRAVGYGEYPQPATPLWPDDWHRDTSRVTRRLPKRTGTGELASDTEYEVTWNYEFESATPLAGSSVRG